MSKSHEEAFEKYKVDTIQSFQDYFLDMKPNFLLHAQVVGGPFDAISCLTSAQLDFDIYFPSRATWEEFVEEWKNSNRLYFADNPTESSVATTTRYDRDANKGVKEGVDEELVDPQDTRANS
ncbi:hypothetical protein PVK06_047316 [Gossypium arboreum]|uniref:Uncharacterized protein n=1 Tax=Gossypium arboreum TaxID=29729 RepID=A0ABR0MFK2_GOSAR|nr:hypothetical protein PVK06_047316 [Gossypium arboreum]